MISCLFLCTLGADALHYIFGLVGNEPFRQWHGRYLHAGEADGLMADVAAQMDMSPALARVVEMAHTVFLGSRTVVNLMKEMALTEQGERSEDGGAVDGGQDGLKVGQTESPCKAVTHLSPDDQSVGCYPYASVDECLFVRYL